MAGLTRKLGIKSKQFVCLLDAPTEMAILLRQEFPEGVSISDALGRRRYDVIIFWPTRLAKLPDRFAQLQRHIVPSGAIWAVIPKQRFARTRGIDFSWSDMQKAALRNDLVDNKVAALSDEEYATRFVIRKNHREGEHMEDKKKLAAPCGLYCGVCAVLMAHRDNNVKFKERLTGVYGVTVDEIKCEGCLSDELFVFCRTCPVRACTIEKEIEGCHQCADFPCKFIEDFPLPVGKKVILRAIPTWRELGTERWMEEEEKRYHCPHCGYTVFRGVRKCRNCQSPLDLD